MRVELSADGVGFRRARRVLVAEEARHLRVAVGGEPRALSMQPAQSSASSCGCLGGDAREVRRAGACSDRRASPPGRRRPGPAGARRSGPVASPWRSDCGESVERVGNPAHPGRDLLPVLRGVARAEVERHADERDRASRSWRAAATARPPRYPSTSHRQPIAHHRRGDAIGVILDRRARRARRSVRRSRSTRASTPSGE